MNLLGQFCLLNEWFLILAFKNPRLSCYSTCNLTNFVIYFLNFSLWLIMLIFVPKCLAEIGFLVMSQSKFCFAGRYYCECDSLVIWVATLYYDKLSVSLGAERAEKLAFLPDNSFCNCRFVN